MSAINKQTERKQLNQHFDFTQYRSETHFLWRIWTMDIGWQKMRLIDRQTDQTDGTTTATDATKLWLQWRQPIIFHFQLDQRRRRRPSSEDKSMARKMQLCDVRVARSLAPRCCCWQMAKSVRKAICKWHVIHYTQLHNFVSLCDVITAAAAAAIAATRLFCRIVTESHNSHCNVDVSSMAWLCLHNLILAFHHHPSTRNPSIEIRQSVVHIRLMQLHTHKSLYCIAIWATRHPMPLCSVLSATTIEFRNFFPSSSSFANQM